MLGLVPGLGKMDFHVKATHPKKMGVAICDLYSAVMPDYTVLDGIEGMEGEGPVTGDTVKLNGQGFEKKVEQNSKTTLGDKLCDFDIDIIKQKAVSDDVLVLATNDSLNKKYKIEMIANDQVVKGDPLYKIIKL